MCVYIYIYIYVYIYIYICIYSPFRRAPSATEPGAPRPIRRLRIRNIYIYIYIYIYDINSIIQTNDSNSSII